MRGGLRRLEHPATRVDAIDPSDTRDERARINAGIRDRQRLLDELLDGEMPLAWRHTPGE